MTKALAPKMSKQDMRASVLNFKTQRDKATKLYAPIIASLEQMGELGQNLAIDLIDNLDDHSGYGSIGNSYFGFMTPNAHYQFSTFTGDPDSGTEVWLVHRDHDINANGDEKWTWVVINMWTGTAKHFHTASPARIADYVRRQHNANKRDRA